MLKSYSSIAYSPLTWFLFLSVLLLSNVPGYARANEAKTIFLSTGRSGANLITNSLQAIVRKPIIWLDGRQCEGSNRLGFIFNQPPPFLYREHRAARVRKMAKDKTHLIVLTRNPKELFFRDSRKGSTLADFEKWFSRYIENICLYESWAEESKRLIFYEDYTTENCYTILLDLISFMGEEPTYYDDFIQNEGEYRQKIYKSYVKQHGENHGRSTRDGALKYTFHSDQKDPVLVRSIDTFISENYPSLWVKYFQRFESK